MSSDSSDAPPTATPVTTRDDICPLGPVDPASIPNAEQEKAAPWVVRKLVGSMTGRMVIASLESLRAAGTSIVCLSPWGDSSPFLLPCIRFRDLAVHTVVAATGGVAAVAAPVMGPVSDAIVSTVGDTILVEMGMHAGFEATMSLADDFVFEKPIDQIVPLHSKKLETTGVKTMLITLKYKHTVEDAGLGFYRSSLHPDKSLFASVVDYVSIEKGWFSPYLFASGRRPVIPRTMKPDLVFCHGPFLAGDYKIGETLLRESAFSICFARGPEPATPSETGTPKEKPSLSQTLSSYTSKLSATSTAYTDKFNSVSTAYTSKLTSAFSHSRSNSHSNSPTATPPLSRASTESQSQPQEEPKLTPLPPPPAPRRMVMVVVGLKPHRIGLWTSSQRPHESVMYYQLMNGCPAVVFPVRIGAPLVAWDGLTLELLWKYVLPADDEDTSKDLSPETDTTTTLKGFDGVVNVLFEFLDLCIEWSRVELPRLDKSSDSVKQDEREPELGPEQKMKQAKAAVRGAVKLFVAAAVRSGQSKEVRKEVDKTRAGIAMWRIP